MNLHIQGWFHPEEGFWYQQQANRLSSGKIVEIGCWKGLSTSYLAPILIHKPQRLWCVDNWQGSKDQYSKFYKNLLIQEEKNGKSVDIQFQENLKKLRIPYKILKMESKKASEYFENESCSLIFIDASHDYNSVKEDLEVWWPKLQHNGVLAGHNFSNDFPGLIKAVKEFVNKKKLILRRGPKSIFFLINK